MLTTTGAPWEYVADEIALSTPPLRELVDAGEAMALLGEYTERRLAAVMTRLPERPAVMLSGGVDSIVVAAAGVRLGLNPFLVTVNVAEHDSSDRLPARLVAEHLGLEHLNVELTEEDVCSRALDFVKVLGTSDIWEVAAAISISAAFDNLTEAGICHGAVFTGGGADVLLGGGLPLPFPASTVSATEYLTAEIWRTIHKSFRRERLIPDFFELVLGSQADRFIEVFQTVEAWNETARFSPTVLYGNSPHGETFDKTCLRDLATQWGIPAELVWVKKSPMQVSSGIFSALERAGRRAVAESPHASTYSNPENEPAAWVIARTWLIAAQNQSSIRPNSKGR